MLIVMPTKNIILLLDLAALATCGSKALEIRLVQTVMYYEHKIHTRLQRLNMGKT